MFTDHGDMWLIDHAEETILEELTDSEGTGEFDSLEDGQTRRVNPGRRGVRDGESLCVDVFALRHCTLEAE